MNISTKRKRGCRTRERERENDDDNDICGKNIQGLLGGLRLALNRFGSK